MKTLKWFLVIFFAVFLANIASTFATTALALAGVKVSLQALNNLKPRATTVRVANPLLPGQTREEALCDSWQVLYRDNPKTPYRQQMELACKSVHGENWVYMPNP